MKPDSFQVVPSSRTRNNENKQTQAVPSQENVFYCEGDSALAQTAQGDCGSSILEEIQKLSGPRQLAIDGSA